MTGKHMDSGKNALISLLITFQSSAPNNFFQFSIYLFIFYKAIALELIIFLIWKLIRKIKSHENFFYVCVIENKYKTVYCNIIN